MEKSIPRRGCQDLQRYRERGKTKELQHMVRRRLLVTLAMDGAGRVGMVKGRTLTGRHWELGSSRRASKVSDDKTQRPIKRKGSCARE